MLRAPARQANFCHEEAKTAPCGVRFLFLVKPTGSMCNQAGPRVIALFRAHSNAGTASTLTLRCILGEINRREEWCRDLFDGRHGHHVQCEKLPFEIAWLQSTMWAIEAISSAGFPANYKPLLEGLAILIFIVVGVEYWSRHAESHDHHHNDHLGSDDSDKSHQ